MGAGELEDALQTFSTLIKSHPEFTEAWNKRATVYFLLGRHHLNPNPSPIPTPTLNPTRTRTRTLAPTPNLAPTSTPTPTPNPNPNLTPIPTVTLTLARTRHHESLADCSVVLEQSRRCHFGALSGAGLVHLELHKEAQARAQEARPPGESVVANHHRRLEHEASSTP